METALNHMTTPNLGYAEFLDLASKLGCVGVEVRNDLNGPLFDGVDAVTAGKLAADKGLRIVGLSQIYPFNSWDSARENEVRALINTAKAAKAETISLIPRNDGTGLGNGARQANLRVALKAILPILQDAGVVALVEPLGFQRSSLRSKSELVSTILSIGGADSFKLVHDTFHHILAEEAALFPEHTGIVHLSAVVDPTKPIDQMEDEDRVLVDGDDRLHNVDQISALLDAGYDGVFSYECFSPLIHAISDPYSEIKRSFEFIASHLQRKAA